jgi:formylglycine-generating enzyme required for sulfatase activity
VVVALSASCAAILGIEEPSIDGRILLDASLDQRDGGEVPIDGPLEASSDAGDAASTAVTRDDAGCPLGRGPSMVALRAVSGGVDFCIDRTEVTLGQWTSFASAAVAPSTQSADCTFNTSFATGNGATDGHPVVSVNWCDAKAFCAWAGKRLCGALAGGPSSPGSSILPTSGQWAYACTNRGATALPYGSFQPDVCNVDHDGGTPKLAGSLPLCANQNGALDLIGNVWEWVDDRTPEDAGAGGDLGYFLGGEYSSPGAYDCATPGAYRVDFRDARVGFRCCADLPP